MTVVTIEEAKERIEELARLAIGGEEVVLTDGGVPAIALTPILSSPSESKRVPGIWAGRFQVTDAFFEPLPDDELDMWEGNSLRGRKLEEIGQDWARNRPRETE